MRPVLRFRIKPERERERKESKTSHPVLGIKYGLCSRIGCDGRLYMATTLIFYHSAEWDPITAHTKIMQVIRFLIRARFLTTLMKSASNKNYP